MNRAFDGELLRQFTQLSGEPTWDESLTSDFRYPLNTNMLGEAMLLTRTRYLRAA